VWCAAWSLGGLLDEAGRALLDAELRTLAPQGLLPDRRGDGDTIYGYLLPSALAAGAAEAAGGGNGGNVGNNANANNGWRPWASAVPSWRYPVEEERPRFSSLVIPTVDSVRYEALLALTHLAGGAPLLVGGPGTAKTTVVGSFVARLPSGEGGGATAAPSGSSSAPQQQPQQLWTSKTITFSYLTTPAIFQTALEACVEKRQGRTFAPPEGRRLALFIDDLAMPARNEWGDQVTSEIVRQLLETGGVYSVEKPIGDVKSVVDVSYVAAMGAPSGGGGGGGGGAGGGGGGSGGRSDIPNRLKRQFAAFYVPPPTAAAIEGIFGTIMAGRFGSPEAGCSQGVAQVAQRLVPATLELWRAAQARLLPTPARMHYDFTLRDLSRVFQGIVLASRDRIRGPALAGAGGGGDGGISSSSASASAPKPPALPPIFGGRAASGEGYLLSLWAHECRRVFADKLVCEEDKGWVDAKLAELMRAGAFSADLVAQAEGTAPAPPAVVAAAGSNDASSLAPAEPLCFVDFLREPVLDDETGEVVEANPSAYEGVPGGLAGLRRRVEEVLRRQAGGGGGGGEGSKSSSSSSSSSSGADADGGLVLFDDALRHLARLSRVLAMERGSALLVGVGGSGRRSLARLAARLAGCAPFELTMTKTYG
jgi:dynein heavy chain